MNMIVATDNILTSFIELNPDHQAALLAKLKVLAPVAETPVKNASEAVAEVWPLFVEAASIKGVSLPPIYAVKRHRMFPKLKDGSETLLRFVENFEPKSKAERQAAIHFCCKAVLFYIESKCAFAPMGIRTITLQLANVGPAVEEMAPGYASANLLNVLIKGLNPKKKIKREVSSV